MIKVKICGITNLDDAKAAVSLGAWALGFVFYKKSPRSVSPYKVKKILEGLPPFVEPVGLFVNQKEGAVKDIAGFLKIRTLQFHGDETPQYCQRFREFKVIKAFRVGERFDISNLSSFPVCAYLFDAYEEDTFGGTGKVFNWEKISNRKFAQPVILSGGLNPQNIVKAIQTVQPYAVDVSSGVEEAPGKKSRKLMEEFFGAIKSSDVKY